MKPETQMWLLERVLDDVRAEKERLIDAQDFGGAATFRDIERAVIEVKKLIEIAWIEKTPETSRLLSYRQILAALEQRGRVRELSQLEIQAVITIAKSLL